MSEQKDLKQLTEVVDFGLGLVKLGLDIAKDKKVDLSDLGLVMASIPGLIGTGDSAFRDMEHIPAELKDMSAEEAAALVSHVMVKLSLEEAKAAAITEKSLKAAVAVYALVKEIVG
jgi:hypothetical protein